MHVFSMPAACVLSQKTRYGWLHLAGMFLQLLASVGSGVTGLPCPDWTGWGTGLPKPPGLPCLEAGLAVGAQAHAHTEAFQF